MKISLIFIFIMFWVKVDAQNDSSVYNHGMTKGEYSHTVEYNMKENSDLVIYIDSNTEELIDYRMLIIPDSIIRTVHPDTFNNGIKEVVFPTIVKAETNKSISFVNYLDLVKIGKINPDFTVDTIKVNQKTVDLKHKINVKKEISYQSNYKHGWEIEYYRIGDLKDICIQDNIAIKSKTKWKRDKIVKGPEHYSTEGIKIKRTLGVIWHRYQFLVLSSKCLNYE